MESKCHVGTRSTLLCKLKRKHRPPAVGRYLYALTKSRGDAALESGLAAAEGRLLCAEALRNVLIRVRGAQYSWSVTMSRHKNTYFSDCEESYLKYDEETEAEHTRRNANKHNIMSRFNS